MGVYLCFIFVFLRLWMGSILVSCFFVLLAFVNSRNSDSKTICKDQEGHIIGQKMCRYAVNQYLLAATRTI
jgi:hypothetical protein